MMGCTATLCTFPYSQRGATRAITTISHSRVGAISPRALSLAYLLERARELVHVDQLDGRVRVALGEELIDLGVVLQRHEHRRQREARMVESRHAVEDLRAQPRPMADQRSQSTKALQKQEQKQWSAAKGRRTCLILGFMRMISREVARSHATTLRSAPDVYKRHELLLTLIDTTSPPCSCCCVGRSAPSPASESMSIHHVIVPPEAAIKVLECPCCARDNHTNQKQDQGSLSPRAAAVRSSTYVECEQLLDRLLADDELLHDLGERHVPDTNDSIRACDAHRTLQSSASQSASSPSHEHRS